jgi:peptide/nickel transport system permease protein
VRRLAARLGKSLLNLLLVVLLGGLAAAALVRYSPGFDVDENSWNPRIEASTLAAIHARRERENRLPVFYARYLFAALKGDFGQSESFRAPVSELLRDRAPVSARLLGAGTAGGLLLGGMLAWLAVWPRRASLSFFASGLSGFLLAVPPAVLALAFFFNEAPLGAAIALALLPRLFGTIRALLEEIHSSPALLAARARGVNPAVLAFRYILGSAAPQWIALAGVALVIAFGSLIPIEALCDVPGIGQLAWKAALSRDLPLLSGLALIVTFFVASVQTLGDLVAGKPAVREAAGRSA